MRRSSPKEGFSLVELLVVMAICVLLASLCIPAFQTVRTASQKSGCISNLSQLGHALTLFANDHDGQFPGMGDGDGGPGPWDIQIEPYLSANSDKVFACPTDVATRRGHDSLEKVRSYSFNPVACSYDPMFVPYGANPQNGAGIRQASIVAPSQFPLLFEHHYPATEAHRNTLGGYDWIVGLEYAAHGAGQNSLFADGHVAFLPYQADVPDMTWLMEYASNLPR